MKKLISFSAFVFIIFMMIAAHAAQAQVIVRPVVAAGIAVYPRPYMGYRGYRRPYTVAFGYYPRPRFYGRPAVRVW